jgi:metallophosphoesterase superfamily enzyme
MINGDIAYDLDSNNGTNYEEFITLLSWFARYVPVFLNTGNHEHNSEDDLKLFYGTF